MVWVKLYRLFICACSKMLTSVAADQIWWFLAKVVLRFLLTKFIVQFLVHLVDLLFIYQQWVVCSVESQKSAVWYLKFTLLFSNSFCLCKQSLKTAQNITIFLFVYFIITRNSMPCHTTHTYLFSLLLSAVLIGCFRQKKWNISILSSSRFAKNISN